MFNLLCLSIRSAQSVEGGNARSLLPAGRIMNPLWIAAEKPDGGDSLGHILQYFPVTGNSLKLLRAAQQV